MIGYAILGLSVLAGYCVTVSLILMATMAVASTTPRFVIAHHRVRARYKWVHEAMWLVCVTAGAFVAAHIGMGLSEWRQELVLIAVLLFMLWRNTWEAKQRGSAHQILISLATVAGVVLGFTLKNRIPL